MGPHAVRVQRSPHVHMSGVEVGITGVPVSYGVIRVHMLCGFKGVHTYTGRGWGQGSQESTCLCVFDLTPAVGDLWRHAS